ncbi:hypothetical protein [Phyllobacterium endophyticum]|uniref:hypothetical protein n=1 Tax=Phyllobacterium endophyticum TaxID=1149773 RepID=UPI0011CC7B8E|nr:hypothetical protein [Phyllobacterium endophyticum]TXR50537.1 hypothetical protein FVA77_04485 [Phyllobacterium endophyticum]
MIRWFKHRFAKSMLFSRNVIEIFADSRASHGYEIAVPGANKLGHRGSHHLFVATMHRKLKAIAHNRRLNNDFILVPARLRLKLKKLSPPNKTFFPST